MYYYLHIKDAKLLPKKNFFEKLQRFRIYIGEGWSWSEKCTTARTLKLKLNTSIELEGVKALLKRTEDLYLQELQGVKNVLHELDWQGFPQLKHLHVQNNGEIQHIIHSMGMDGHCVAFQILESLYLENLNSLKKICQGKLASDSFSSLRMLKVAHCHGLENIFSFSIVRSLSQLEDIQVRGCKIMKQIVAEETGDDAVQDETIELKKLRSLTLQNLPQLTSFFSETKSSSTLQTRQKPMATDVESEEIVSEIQPEPSIPTVRKKVCLYIHFSFFFLTSIVATPYLLKSHIKN